MSRWNAIFASNLHGLVSRAFALVAMFSLFIALAVGMAGGLWLQGRSQSANMALVAQNAAYVAEVPMVFNDAEAAREVLRPNLGGNDVTAIRLLDGAGRVFAEVRRDSQSGFDAFAPAALIPSPVRHNISSAGGVIGSVEVVGSGDAIGALIAVALVITLFGILLVAAGTYLIARSLGRNLVTPLHAIVDVAREVRLERRFDLRAQPHGVSEVRELAGGFNALLDQLQTWQGQNDSAQEALLYRASIDPLSGLPNRATFLERLRETLGMAQRSGDKLAVLFLDGNHFKETNDQYGHAAGDRVIAEVAARISPILRIGDMAARVGGDEFAVLVNHLEGTGDAKSVARRIREAMSVPIAITDADVATVSLSIGSAIFPDDGRDVDTLLRVADERMYADKISGREAEHWNSP
ncbi:MAG: diguanylate cyclase [Sphingomonadaceae bacterium]|nr:diguanylate cyclase [Sphingomonadaceae bacterium]